MKQRLRYVRHVDEVVEIRTAISYLPVHLAIGDRYLIWASSERSKLFCEDFLILLFCRLNLDASWSETGDRYMLKLFRDYLFHSVTADGRPWLDQAHLAHCLNQLDGGTTARVS